MTESIFKFALGQEVQDQITKTKGIITARSEWITGCNTYMVQPMAKAEGEKAPEIESYDETRLIFVTEGVSKTFQGYYKPDAVIIPTTGKDFLDQIEEPISTYSKGIVDTKPKKPGGPSKILKEIGKIKS